MQGWWGGTNHPNIGYSDKDPATMTKIMQDHASRGYDTIVLDWYGPTIAGGGLLKTLDVAGSILTPGAMAVIPGTTFNHNLQIRKAEGAVNSDIAQQAALTNIAKDQADIDAKKNPPDKTKAPSIIRNPVTGMIEGLDKGDGTYVSPTSKDFPQQLQDILSKETPKTKAPTPEEDKQHTRDLEKQLAAGTIADEDRKDLAARQQEAKLQGVGSEIHAQVGDPPVPAQFPKGKDDPAYKAADKQWGAAVQALKTKESTAGVNLRIQAQEETPYNVLDTNSGSMNVMTRKELADANKANPGRYVLSGQGGTAALGKQANAENIHQSFQNVLDHVGVLDKGLTHRAIVAAALADPSTTATEFAQSAAAGQLTPEEQDFVISVKNAREQIQGLRALTGSGQTSDMRIKAILQTLPNASTPNSTYARKQMETAMKDLERVTQGIPKVGNTKVGNANLPGATSNTPPPSNMIQVQIPGYPPGTIFADKKDEFLKKHPNAKVLQ
jgi:hypothetical protein